ncbi:hypothetical protein PHLCEN_2v4152 [Hermanssonia centrifuga]|uniref:Uncharacterized protein n=1 Tax=Hermanssonia centrifuga TaxID=98765 RepID=A0A2R6PZ50_9APHY|nr:hypothetical protein PHLCEN_2v4152 [Hermanssonia centrifuga]
MISAHGEFTSKDGVITGNFTETGTGNEYILTGDMNPRVNFKCSKAVLQYPSSADLQGTESYIGTIGTNSLDLSIGDKDKITGRLDDDITHKNYISGTVRWVLRQV